MIDIRLSRGGEGAVYSPALLEGTVWETSLSGAPGRLSFSVLDHPSLEMGEGDAVCAEGVFTGHVFTRRYSQNGVVSVTAYDQTRYLKNRDTVTYDGITASELLRRAAAAHGIALGAVAETGVRLEPCTEDSKTLMDILRNALAKTEAAGGGVFALYDDCGAVTLAKAADMRRDLLIRPGAAQTFTRTLSIDKETYNSVKLVCEKKSGRSVTTAADQANIRRWGHLQHFEKIADDFGARAKADELLRRYNRVTRELTVGGIAGDVSVRAGCSLYVDGKMAGGGGETLCVVERARHVWKDGGHFMELEMSYA